MKGTVFVNTLIGLLLSMSWSTSAWAQTLTSFTATYKGGTASCISTYNIKGKEPSAAGAYPVFVYLVGTTEAYDHVSALSAVDKMAARGYVAATVQYPNSTFGDCTTLSGRSKCIFDASNPSSAISALCARANADCTKGVVVAGLSQGSVLAVLARNYDTRVQAAYGLGVGVQYSTYDLRACVANGRRALPGDRLRAVNGEADMFMGGTASTVRGQLEELTGLTCAYNPGSCFRTNKSGWYIVKHSEVADGNADHCYMRQGGCIITNNLDPQWLSGSAEWSLDANLQWLTGFTQR